MKNIVIVRKHAIIRYAERVLQKPVSTGSPYDEITTIIRREIAEATPLSPMQRAIFLDPRRGINPNDEYLMWGSTVYVLNQPPRGGRRTCITIIVATPAQLATISDISVQEDEEANAHMGETRIKKERVACEQEHQRAIEVDRAKRRDEILRLFLETFVVYFGATARGYEDLRILLTRTPQLIRYLKRSQLPAFFPFVGDALAIKAFWERWQRVLDGANLR